MKHFFDKTLLLAATFTAATFMSVQTEASATGTQPRFRHISTVKQTKEDSIRARFQKAKDAIITGEYEEDSLYVRTPDEIIAQTEVLPDIPSFNRLNAPWVFCEYRALDKQHKIAVPSLESQNIEIWRLADRLHKENQESLQEETTDSVAERRKYLDELWGIKNENKEETEENEIFLDEETKVEPLHDFTSNPRPRWLENAYEAWDMQEDLMYQMMVDDPSLIRYAYWRLPIPPSLPEEDHGFMGFLKRSSTGSVNVNDAVISESEILKKHWLHVLNGSLQFSQAYVSDNWYQGGNNHVALLINFLWDVQLNTVWHPNLLLQSTLSYKLGLNSVEDDQYRKYSISQDIFQYNFKFGYKARRNWYYTITAQFKTQLLNNYKKDTETRIASVLTPGDLNFGLGMTYSKTNASKSIQFNASIAPLSYNLKTAIDPHIDHELFGIPQTVKSQSEIGSNADITLNWKIGKMVTYKTRLFLFTDYDYFLGDWENTLNIQFSRFFSTQLYANLRYDSSADKYAAPKWKRFMLKEILSIGLSYTFSTKQ